MSSTTTVSGLAGAWFGELASALQGKWQAVAAASGEQRPRRQRKLGAGGLGERSKKASGEAAGAVRRTAAKEEEDVGLCGGAMSDATLCLLLDRFAPS